jgi:hypothetical protein
MFLSPEEAFNAGLHCSEQGDYWTALRFFEVSERKYRRKRYDPAFDAVLAARAGQAFCQLKLERYHRADQLAQSVLANLGRRTEVKGFTREAIEGYRSIAATQKADTG